MEQATINTTLPKTWKKTTPIEEIYTADDVVEAYLTGKKAGIKASLQPQVIVLQQNLVRVDKATRQLLNTLKKKLNPKTAYLKITHWNNFEVLITIPEKEFVSKEFLKVYDDSQKAEDILNKDSIIVSYSFAPVGSSFNETHVGSDGFFLKQTIKK